MFRPTALTRLAALALACHCLAGEVAQAQLGGTPIFRPPGGVGPGAGGPGGGFDRGTLFAVLRDEAAQTELKLTDEQKQKITPLQEAARPGREWFTQFGEAFRLPADQRDAKMAELRKQGDEIRKQAESKLTDVLSADQLKRARQLALRQAGARGLMQDEVASDLKLTDDQKSKVKAILDAPSDPNVDYRSMKPEDFQKLRDEREAKALAVLEEAQRKTYDEKLGPPSEANKTETAITASTKTNPLKADAGKADAVKGDAASASTAAKPDAATPPASGEVVSSFAVAAREGAKTSKQGDQSSDESPKNGSKKPDGKKPASTKNEKNDPKKPEPAKPEKKKPETAKTDSKKNDASKPVAKSGTKTDPKNDAKTAEDKTDEPAVANADAEEKRLPEKLSFNFRQAPWVDVLRLFAEVSGLTPDLQDIPPGTFNYYDQDEYTPTEALDILNGYLLPRGYLLIRRNRFLVSISVDKPIPPNLVPLVRPSDIDTRGLNELFSVILPLNGLEPEVVAKEVEALLGPQGKVTPLKASNSIFVQDVGSHLRQIADLVTGVAPSDKDALVFRSFALKHIPATDAERHLRSLFGLDGATKNVSMAATGQQPQQNTQGMRWGGFSGFGGGGFGGGGWGGRGGRDGGGRDGGGRGEESRFTPSSGSSSSTSTSTSTSKMRLASDMRKNTLLVSATQVELKFVEEVLKSIDVEESPEDAKFAGGGTPTLRAYKVENADASEVAKTLDSYMPGVVINEDRRSGMVHVRATASEHKEIEELIRRLDGVGGQQVEIVRLGKFDPAAMAKVLNGLFEKDGDKAPTIHPEPLTRTLMIRGTADQVAQVRKTLTAYGEDGTGTGKGGFGQGGRFRTVTTAGRDPEKIARIIEEHYARDEASSTEIRVKIPLDEGPQFERRVPSAPEPEEPRDDRGESRIEGRPESRPASRAEARPVSEVRPATRPEPRGDAAAARQRGDEPPAPRGVSPGPRPEERRPESRRTEARDAEPRRPESRSPESRRPAPNDEDEEDTSDAAADELPKQSAKRKPANEPPLAGSRSSESQPASKPGKQKPRVTLEVQGGDLHIYSSDEAALDDIEEMIAEVSQQVPLKTTWTIFYLRSTTSTEASAMLSQLLPDEAISTGSSSSSGSSSIMDSLTSLGGKLVDMSGLGSATATSDALRIIPDERTNSLYVTGPSHKVRDVEKLLKVIDASETPESLRDRVPRTIPVRHGDVNTVATMIRDIYRDALEDPRQAQMGRGGANPFAMLLGGGGTTDRNRGGRPQGIRLTLAVDNAASELIVSCDDALFREIQDLVADRERSAQAVEPTVRVVALDDANRAVVQSALSAMSPKIQVSTTGSRGFRQQQSSGSSDSTQGNDAAAQEALRQRMMMNAFQGGGLGGRNTGGGNFGGRTFGGGNQGGGRSFGGGNFGGGNFGGGNVGGGNRGGGNFGGGNRGGGGRGGR